MAVALCTMSVCVSPLSRQVRLLEELQASRVQCHTSLEALTRVLLQACFSGARVSRAGLHPNGAWLADALDILQIRQACLVQRAHHVAAGAARRWEMFTCACGSQWQDACA